MTEVVQRFAEPGANDNVVSRFASLFEGRKDAYGTDDGGCFRPQVYHGEVGKPYWETAVELHLGGAKPIGVYPVIAAPVGPIAPDGAKPRGWVPTAFHCKWGCVDLDADKPSAPYETQAYALTAAFNLQRALKALEIVSWVERSKSGAHVWVFAKNWTEAKIMRRALLVGCLLADVPPKEVNPKQTELPTGSPGNYVRLPYPGALVASGSPGGGGLLHDPPLQEEGRSQSARVDRRQALDDGSGRSGASDGDSWGGRRAVRDDAPARSQDGVRVARSEERRRSGADDDALSADGSAATGADTRMPRRVVVAADSAQYPTPLSLTRFVDAAYVNRVDNSTLAKTAALWREPEKPRVQVETVNIGNLTPLLYSKLNGYAYKMWSEGPLSDDRSGYLYKLAHHCRESGLQPQDALAVVADADRTHTQKYTDRSDAERRYSDLIGKVYA